VRLFSELELSQFRHLLLHLVHQVLRLLQLGLPRGQQVPQLCVLLLESRPLVLMLVPHGLLVELNILAGFGPLEELLDDELVLLAEGGDELHDLPVLDQQFEELLQQQLQLVQVALLHQPEQRLLAQPARRQTQRFEGLRHHLADSAEVVHALLHVALSAGVALPHHARQTERLGVTGELGDVGDAEWGSANVVRRQAWKSSGLKRSCTDM
jgi:hypothetical protein